MTEEIEVVENTALTKYLPTEYHGAVTALARPSQDELIKISDNLSDEYKEKITSMVVRSNSSKPGLRTSEQNFNPMEIRIYHGTGTDPNRPPSC